MYTVCTRKSWGKGGPARLSHRLFTIIILLLIPPTAADVAGLFKGLGYSMGKTTRNMSRMKGFPVMPVGTTNGARLMVRFTSVHQKFDPPHLELPLQADRGHVDTYCKGSDLSLASQVG